MKKIKRKVTFLLLALQLLSFSKIANAHPNHYTYGWINGGTPKYSYSGSSIFNKSDLSNTDIMYKVKNSYTYKTRMAKIPNSTYVQTLMYDYINLDDGAGKYWSNITYTDMTPNGSIGYTQWYDSPNGVVLDYLSKYLGGNTTPTVSSEPVSYNIKKDMMDWNDIQYSNPSKAYIASTYADANLADAKSASALSRTDSSRNYPIYLNDGLNIDSDVKSKLISKNIKDLYIMGGYARFNFTAGLTDGFNIIRAGGSNTQTTYEYFSNLPTKINEPQHYTPDSNGIVISGDLGQQYSIAYQYLEKVKNTKDVNVLVDLAYILSSRMNIGKEPSKSDTPSLVLGVNIANFETYWIVYYSNTLGHYVYQFVLPGYYEKFQPINDSLTISGSPYQNGNDYWFKPNSTITINTKAYMSSVSSNYPDTMSLLLGSAEYNLKTNSSSTNTAFNNEFKVSSGSASRSVSNNKNYLSATHKFVALYDNKTYDVKFTSKLGSYTAPIVTTGKRIRTDGTAPQGTVNYNYDETTSNLEVKVSNVVETGSGVDKIWIKYWDKENPNKVLEKVLTNNNGVYTGTIDLFEAFGGKADNVVIEAWGIDKVGNSQKLSGKEIDIFTVSATIERVLEPHTPSFKGGEKGVLKITLTGGVEKVKITFPTELTQLDETLNTEITLTPKKYETLEYEFFVPLYTVSGNYDVRVTGVRNGVEKNVYPTFRVTDGKIIDEVKSIIIYPGREKRFRE